MPEDRETTFEDARREIFRRIMVEGLGHSLKAQAPDGSRPVLVVQEHELMSSVLPRVDAAGGAVNIFVVEDNRSISGATLRRSAVPLDLELDLGPEGLSGDIEVGMIALAGRRKGAGITFRMEWEGAEIDVTSTSRLALT